MAMLNNQRVCDDDNYDGIRDTIMADRMGSIMMIDYSWSIIQIMVNYK